MNRPVFIIIAVLFISFSCRKKTEREVKIVDTFEVLHCYNGALDEDELGRDCGGKNCEPCKQIPAPCNTPDDEMYLYEGFTFDNKSFTSKSIDSTNNNGRTDYYAYTDGSTSYYLKLSFVGKPDISRTYKGVSEDSFLKSDEVYVLYNGSYDYDGTGDVYVTYENGAYTFESCDYSFSKYGQNAPQDAQWFRVTF